MKFTLSDSTSLNSYGFYVDVASIILDRFATNPVMLLDHKNSIESIAGKWVNIERSNGQLQAEPEFDEGDEAAVKAKGKVERGYLKGASVGLNFIEGFTEFRHMPDGSIVLFNAELIEASLCAVPSDKNALRLYAASTGEQLLEDDIEVLKLSAKTDDKNKTNPMKKIMLSAVALNALALSPQAEGHELPVIEKAIEDLAFENKKLKDANERLIAEQEAALKEKAGKLVDDAIAAGKLSATQKEEWTKLAISNYSLAESTLAGIPTKVSLSNKIDNPAGGDLPKTKDDFQKMNREAQLAFKANYPSEYAQLFSRK